MRINKILISILISLVSVNVFAAGDYQAGKVIAYTCTGCHGIKDYKNTYPMYRVPRIAGQNSEYVIAALQAYQSGSRQHGTMNLQAESLSAKGIEDIAAYVSTQVGNLTAAFSTGNATEGENKSTACHACHGAAGKSSQPIYPNLGGQHQDYLSKAIHDYRDGSRQNAIMNGFAANLSDSDIEDIAAWYASQEGLSEIQDK